jgi:hypothetical protein
MGAIALILILTTSLNPVEPTQKVEVTYPKEDRILQCKRMLDKAYEEQNKVYQGSTLSFCTATYK